MHPGLFILVLATAVAAISQIVQIVQGRSWADAAIGFAVVWVTAALAVALLGAAAEARGTLSRNLNVGRLTVRPPQ